MTQVPLNLGAGLDRDLQVVHDRGCRPQEIEALLRCYQPWVARLARGRWRRSRRAHVVLELQDVENLIRVGVWKALLDFRYLCSAGCERGGQPWASASRAEWEAHLARRHAGAAVPPKNDVGRHVRIAAVNEVNAEARRYYKKKRIASRYADEVVPVEVVEHLRRRVLPPRSIVHEELMGAHAVDEATDDAPDLGVQLAELAAEARRELAPAAQRVVARLVEGEALAEAAEAEAPEWAVGQTRELLGRATARRAHNFLQAWAEREFEAAPAARTWTERS